MAIAWLIVMEILLLASDSKELIMKNHTLLIKIFISILAIGMASSFAAYNVLTSIESYRDGQELIIKKITAVSNRLDSGVSELSPTQLAQLMRLSVARDYDYIIINMLVKYFYLALTLSAFFAAWLSIFMILKNKEKINQ